MDWTNYDESTARLVDHQVSRHLDQQGNPEGALDQTK